MYSLRIAAITLLGGLLAFPFLAADKPAWTTIQVPGAWEDVSEGRFEKYDGTAWYRCFVKVPVTWKGADLELVLRQIDDCDETFFNGEKVGGMGDFSPKFKSAAQADRRYKIRSALVKPGESNVLTIRVHDGGDKGGLVGGSPLLRNDKLALRLDGQWQFRTGDDTSWSKVPPVSEADDYFKIAKPLPGHRGIEDYAPLAKADDKLPDAVQGAKGLDDVLRVKIAKMAGGVPLSPQESFKRFKTPDDLRVDLIANEPEIRQPLNITFDERGRMWVVQYLQYPFPAGLKIVSYDRYIRAKFDKVPPPPPKHFRGADKITILEDSKGNGTFDKLTHFVEGLSITTSALPGRGGVWILNPPYLLFYPDKNRDDIPDGDPVVHLSGFGLEDTHAVANSLMWGPDGWIYGAQGSTCTAKVKVEIGNDPKTTDFLGQAIWRYHPEKHLFEIYAEGGGNTFGVEIDDEGRVFSGTNWGTYRGLHFVQGGNYVKGWGKHGPLTNPYAFGFFQHMPHTGNADRLTHTYIVYGESGLPDRYRGKIIGPSALQKRIQVTRLEPHFSTFKTTEEPFLLTTTDGWFRPVDCKSGPDGALYIADFYENRIDHVDPRDTWDRRSGRIYRLRAADAKPLAPFDLAKKSSADLVKLLASNDRWYRRTALRLLGDRKDRTIAPELRKLLQNGEGQVVLEGLWALHQTGSLEEQDTLKGLTHKNPAVRRWAIRLLGDDRSATPLQLDRLLALAATEAHSEVRSQLASSVKRLPGKLALPLLKTMLQHDEDQKDPQIPLLLWWALEAHAADSRAEIVRLFESPDFWRRPLVDQIVLERLMQRYALAGGKDDLVACARLLQLAPEAKQTERLLTGLDASLAGGSASKLPDELKTAIAKHWNGGAGGARLALGVRAGLPDAVETALKIVADEKAEQKKRLDFIRLFGEVEEKQSLPTLLKLIDQKLPLDIRQTALSSLRRYEDDRIASRALELFVESSSNAEMKTSLLSLLSSRPAWTLQLLKAIDARKVDPRGIPLDMVRQMKRHNSKDIADLIGKHWGKVRETTPAEKVQEFERISAILRAGQGDVKAGKIVFNNTCGKCHKLFKEGGEVGPELTGYERDNLGFWLENIIDPSAAVRDEYTNFLVQTTDGRSLSGIIVEQNKQAISLRGPDGQTVKLTRDRIEDLSASPISLMPDDQMKLMSEQQIRDLITYLRTKTPIR